MFFQSGSRRAHTVLSSYSVNNVRILNIGFAFLAQILSVLRRTAHQTVARLQQQAGSPGLPWPRKGCLLSFATAFSGNLTAEKQKHSLEPFRSVRAFCKRRKLFLLIRR